jgi:hypothetical protein
MRKSDCTSIRRELDEIMLGDEWSVAAAEHMAVCTDCRNFNEKQMKLRQIVGSLETVAAPPDFDFRLRSRLARDNGSSGARFNYNVWSLGQRSAAVGLAVLLVFGAWIVVRQVMQRSNEKSVAEKNNGNTGKTAPSRKDESLPNVTNPTPTGQTQQFAVNTGPRVGQRRSQSTTNRTKRPLMAKEISNEQAPVIRSSEPIAEQVFPIDASQQSLKVSLYDGRGNPRTISLPTVTFGSQRVVPTSTSFAPKGVW